MFIKLSLGTWPQSIYEKVFLEYFWEILLEEMEKPRGGGWWGRECLFFPIWNGNIFYTILNPNWKNMATCYIQNWKEKSLSFCSWKVSLKIHCAFWLRTVNVLRSGEILHFRVHTFNNTLPIHRLKRV